MASTSTTSVAPFGAIAIFRVINLVESTFSALENWNETRKSNKVLGSLSVAQLDDIGLSQCDGKFVRNAR